MSMQPSMIAAVTHERLQFVLRGLPVSLASTIALSIVTVAVLWPEVAHARLIGWLSTLVVVSGLRATLWGLTRSRYIERQPARFWQVLFIIGCGLSGSVWGITPLLFQPASPSHEIFIAIVIAGTAAGAITSLAADRWAAFALVLPCVLPFTLSHLAASNPVDIAIGVVSILFLATIGGSINRFHRQLAIMMKAQFELQASESSVKALNERMHLATSVAKVGIYEWDLVTNQVNWDAQVYELWDLDPRDGSATLDAWRARIHPADLSKTQARFQEIFNSVDCEFDLEFRVVARNGVVRDIRSRGRLDRDPRSVPIRMIGLVVDVTELRRLDRLKQEFISVVSHELRTPVTAIRGALGIMTAMQGGATPDQSQKMVELANRNAERLGVLINDILDMDKIDSGRMRFELADHDLGELLSQAVAANTAYADRFGVVLAIKPLEQPVRVHVDGNRIVQVLSNLISNAAKFSPKGANVDVSAHADAGLVRVSIKDSGPGIPEEFQPHIFGKFCQSADSQAQIKGGSGLGLAISKAMIEAMRGTIGFTTAPGQGTTFYFELPRVTTDRTAESTGQASTARFVSLDLAS